MTNKNLETTRPTAFQWTVVYVTKTLKFLV